MGEDDVKTWIHQRKGKITGVVEGGDDTWVRIRLTGDHQLRMASSDDDGFRADGTYMTIRRTLLTEVTDADR